MKPLERYSQMRGELTSWYPLGLSTYPKTRSKAQAQRNQWKDKRTQYKPDRCVDDFMLGDFMLTSYYNYMNYIWSSLRVVVFVLEKQDDTSE